MLRVGLGRITPINARTGGPTGGGTPSFLLDFADAGAGVVNVAPSAPMGVSATFTRATDATTVLSNGLIGTVASGSPRSYYDPTSLTYLGYLAEGARTNICLRSEDFTTTWSNAASTETADATTAPDGAATADKLAEDNTTAVHGIQQSITFADATAYTFSVFLKASERSWAYLQLPAAAFTADGGAHFNLGAGAVGTTFGGATATIKAYPNGWYRCTVTKTSTAAAAGNALLGIASADATFSYLGVTGNGIFAWGAQVEAGAFASSYIATVGATVTRNADVLTYPLTGWFSATAGTLLVRGTNGIYSTGAFPLQASLHDGTVNEEINFFRLTNSTTARFAVTDGGAGQAAIALTTADSVPFAFSGAYAVNDFSAAFNGTLGTPDTSGTLPTVTTLGIACNANGNQPFGATRRFAYFPSRLPNAQLVAMTS